MLNRNNKPTELQRYKKNTKQKKILIGTILLFLLIIGGIKLYRTFALYKEEKSFNVLKGIVPDFHTYYKESILNGAYPELKEGLIPVTIDNEGTVRKADINEPWYSYENQEWANAIIKQNSYDALDAYGKVNGATKKDGYVEFDGVDDYIDLGLENYDFGNTASIAIRLSFNEIKNNYQSLLGNWQISGFGLQLNSNNTIAFGVYIEGETNVQAIISDVIPELNKTYTIVGTYDGKEIKVYVNGELVGSKEIIGEIQPSSMPFNIGANPNPNNHQEYAPINVYQAAIFERALTEEEIENNFSEEIKIYDNKELLKYVDFTEREEEAEEIIPEDIIESYFVWIPKYRYKIFNMGEYNNLVTTEYEEKSKPIEIKFGLTNTIDDEEECIAPPSGENGNCTVNKWMTHPAFTAFDTKGIWVGKFETGYNGATGTGDANKNENKSEQVIIKPNVYSWRYINISNAYLTSINYNKDLNSHMMKNTEWGAVAYLQHSKYGSHDNVRLNNNSAYLTGYSAKEEPTCGYTMTNEACNKNEFVNKGIGKEAQDGEYSLNYFNTASVLSSTTGNYTGIFDMSGGAWEYVMGIMVDQNGKPASGRHDVYNSGFNGTLTCPTCKDTNATPGGKTEITDGEEFPTDTRYYDIYAYSTNGDDYTRGILGDATKEIGPFRNESYSASNGTKQTRHISSWYKDESWLAFVSAPWVSRGGSEDYGIGSGIFASVRPYGNASSSYGFRLVLAF